MEDICGDVPDIPSYRKVKLQYLICNNQIRSGYCRSDINYLDPVERVTFGSTNIMRIPTDMTKVKVSMLRLLKWVTLL